ncbi:uncharacterized protein PAF06_012458 [Gastrophryne carolinensis]
MRLNPQSAHLAHDDPYPSSEGVFFGDSFLKDLSKYVGLFNFLDKAQSSLKRIFSEFTCLPFGLSSAPWCFTKLMKPVVALLRSRGVCLIIYLDNILIMASSLIHLHSLWTITLLTDLGLLSASIQVIFPAPLHYRAIQRLKS